jgi:hypothetical protein
VVNPANIFGDGMGGFTKHGNVHGKGNGGLPKETRAFREKSHVERSGASELVLFPDVHWFSPDLGGKRPQPPETVGRAIEL